MAADITISEKRLVALLEPLIIRTVTPIIVSVVGNAIGGLRAEMNDRFNELYAEMNNHFLAVDKHFVQVEEHLTRIDGRLGRLENHAQFVDKQLVILVAGQRRLDAGLAATQKMVFDHTVDTDMKLRGLQWGHGK